MNEEREHRALLELKSQLDDMQEKINWLIRCAKKKAVGLGCGLNEDNKRRASGGHVPIGWVQSNGPQPVKLSNIVDHIGPGRARPM